MGIVEYFQAIEIWRWWVVGSAPIKACIMPSSEIVTLIANEETLRKKQVRQPDADES